MAGLSDEVLLDELLRTIARLGFYEVAEVVGREVQRIGEVAHSGHSLTGSEALGKIVVEQDGESLNQLAVDGFAGDAIVRRYPRSIRALFEFMPECDATLCFDSSLSTVKPIFKYDHDVLTIYDQDKYNRIRSFLEHDGN